MEMQGTQPSPPPMPVMPEPAHAAERPEYMQLLPLQARFKSGTNWFYWIAGLSLVNSVLLLSGANFGFVVGLGATQMIDSIVLGVSEDVQAGWAMKLVAFAIDVVIAGVYVLIGFLGLKRMKAAIIVGMVFYAIDGLLFLLVQDFLSLAFHGFALWCIFGGIKALNEYNRLEARLIASEPAAA